MGGLLGRSEDAVGKAELDGALGRKICVLCRERLYALGRKTAAIRQDLRQGLASLHETPACFLECQGRAPSSLRDERVVSVTCLLVSNALGVVGDVLAVLDVLVWVL